MLNELMFAAAFAGISLLIGRALLVAARSPSDLFADFAWGVASVFALFHVVAYPLFLAKARFTVLLYAFAAVLAAVTVVSAAVFLRSGALRGAGQKICGFLKNAKRYPVLTLLAAGVLALAVYTGVFCYHPTSDDGYYIVRSAEILENNCLDILPSQTWFGTEVGNYEIITDASTLSMFVSWLSFVTKLSPVILCRRTFALLMIAAQVSVLITVLKKLSGWTGEKRYPNAALFIAVCFLFQLRAEKVNSAGRWITDYGWQGKSLLISLIFPLLLCACADVMKRTCDGEKVTSGWLPVSVALTAGIGVSQVGLFLPAILYFGYGMAFLISTRFRYVKSVLLPAILSLLPVLICGGISYFRIATVNTMYFTLGKTPEWTWMGQLLRSCDMFQLLLWLAGSVWLLFFGKNRLRTAMLVTAPAIFLLTLMNPLLAGPVSTYVTTADVYFRLFWLLPVYIVPALAVTDAADRILKGELQRGIVCIGGVLILIWGFASETYYVVNPKLTFFTDFLRLSAPARANPEGVSAEIAEIASAVLEDFDGNGKPKLLTKYDEYSEIRQYSPGIVTFWKQQPDPIPGTEISQSEFIATYDELRDPGELHSLLEKLGADYVCVRDGSGELLSGNDGFTEIRNVNGTRLFRVG